MSCQAPRECSAIMRARKTSQLRAKRPAVAPHIGGLIGHAGMIGAVGQAGDSLAAAEKEIGAAGIADWPAAGVLVELEQCAALTEGDHIVDEFGFWLAIELVGMSKRGVAAHGGARHPQQMRMRSRFARPRRGCRWR